MSEEKLKRQASFPHPLVGRDEGVTQFSKQRLCLGPKYLQYRSPLSADFIPKPSILF